MNFLNNNLTPIPPRLLEWISSSKKQNKKTSKGSQHSIQEYIVVEGGRNNNCFKIACRLSDYGLPLVVAEASLQGVNRILHNPPLPQDEVLQTVRSAYFTANSTDADVYTLEDFYKEDKFKTPEPLVHSLINKGEFHIMSATAKTGKTLAQLHLAIALARGEKFLDYFETQKGTKCLIIQTEVSNRNLAKRIRKICGPAYEDIKDKLFFTDKRIKLDTPQGISELKAFIKKYGVELIILDPFYTLHNKLEDKSSDMAPILSDIREVATKNNVAVLLIHHQGKKSETGSTQTGHRARGSSSFADVPDASWSLEATSEPGFARLSIEARNIESPGPFKCFKDPETLKWRVVEHLQSSHENKVSIDAVIDYVKENEGISSGSLADQLSALLGASKRSVQSKMKEAIEANKLKKEKEGNKTFYKTINN